MVRRISRAGGAFITLLVVASLTTLGCRKDKDPAGSELDETGFAQDGSDTSAAETDAQLITSSLISSSPGTIGLASADLSGSDLGGREFGDGAKAIYLPRGCLTVVHDPATQTATYTFNRCLGPNGLRAITGEVKAHYRVAPELLHLELTATDLSVNEAVVDWSATADVTSTEADRTMVWKAQLAGTSARGRTFSRTNQHTVSWKLGEPCFALSGSSEGEIDKRSIRTEIIDFRRCRRGCPDAGGRIVITNVTKNKSIELRYDGTNTATFVDVKGRETPVPLLCRP
jgi:hypothetical protein